MKNEEIYLKKAQAGDKEAMEALFKGYEGLLMNASKEKYLTSMGDEALVTIQESFFEAIRAFDTSSGVPFSAYARTKIYGDIRNAYQQAINRQAREIHPIERGDDGSLWDTFEDIYNTPERYELSAMFKLLLKKLTPQQQMLITLIYFKNYTQKAAAVRIGISEPAVVGIKNRALATLRAELMQEYN